MSIFGFRQEIEITPEFEFLILACDGLWDTITSKEAVKHVAARFGEGYSAQVGAVRPFTLDCGSLSRADRLFPVSSHSMCLPRQQASHSLANLAIRSGSSDNVSVVIVLLNVPPKRG